MEGLDVTILRLSEVLESNEKIRIDARYFSKLAVESEKRIEAMEHIELGDACVVFRKGIFDIKASSYTEEGIPFVRIGDLHDGLIDSRDIAQIAPEVHIKESNTALEFGDVVLSKTGYAAAAFVNLPRCNVSQDIIAVKLSSQGSKRLKTGYLVSYLNSRHGLALLDRQFQGNVQEHLSLPDGRKVLVPIIGKELQARIDETVRKSIEQLSSADQQTETAAAMLTEKLGLKKWTPSDPLTYTRESSEAFAAARFDAEHFRPKYAELIQKMKSHGRIVRLGNCLSFCERGRQPVYSEQGLPVVNSRHVSGGTVELDSQNRYAQEDAGQLKLAEENRLTIKFGDVLMNGTGVGTLGRSAAYLYVTKALPDNHVTILRLRPAVDLDPVFLAAMLNSAAGQMQVEQYFKGSSGQIELYPTDIKKFYIWLAPRDVQQEMRGLLETAHKMRQGAMAMLEGAKCAVEIAINGSELKALERVRGV